MKIQILGTGCPKCRKLADLAETAVTDLGLDAEVVKVTDITDIMEFNVMVTPALAVDGEVKSAGRIPTLDEIKGWLGPEGA
jgi:small redox-active disulfide protein 2